MAKKTPIILIHGFRGNGLGLKQLGSHFDPEKYDIHIPVLPPFGESAETLPTYNPENYAKFMANYIKTHNLDRPILVGHSMGSVVAAATAEKYPELINDKIVFLAPIATKPPRWIANLQPLVTVFPNKLIGYLSTQYMIVDRTDLKPILETTYRCGEYYGDKRNLRAATRFSTDYAISDFNFKKCALFLAGEKDRLVSQKDTRTVAAKYQAKTVFLEGTGHLLNYEKLARTAKAIAEFIEN